MRTERLGLAEKVLKGQEAVGTYQAKAGQNMVSLVAKVDGSEQELAPLIADYNTPMYSAVDHLNFGRNYVAGNQTGLAELVLSELSDTVNDLSREVTPKFLLSGQKPKRFASVPTEFMNRFEAAYGADKVLQDEEALAKKADSYKAELMSKLKSPGMVAAVQNGMNKESALRNVKRKLVAEVQPFLELFENGGINDGRRYVMEFMNSLPDDQKAAEAVRLGIATYESDEIRKAQEAEKAKSKK